MDQESHCPHKVCRRSQIQWLSNWMVLPQKTHWLTIMLNYDTNKIRLRYPWLLFHSSLCSYLMTGCLLWHWWLNSIMRKMQYIHIDSLHRQLVGYSCHRHHSRPPSRQDWWQYWCHHIPQTTGNHHHPRLNQEYVGLSSSAEPQHHHLTRLHRYRTSLAHCQLSEFQIHPPTHHHRYRCLMGQCSSCRIPPNLLTGHYLGQGQRNPRRQIRHNHCRLHRVIQSHLD